MPIANSHVVNHTARRDGFVAMTLRNASHAAARRAEPDEVHDVVEVDPSREQRVVQDAPVIEFDDAAGQVPHAPRGETCQ
jgi:hypothetical protein